MVVPTLTINELSSELQSTSINGSAKKVLEGILNDYMDLQYGKETPYTTGQQVLPSGSTIGDVDSAIAATDNKDKKFKDIYVTISETFKSGDLTPRSTNDGTWDSKFTPVLVFLTPNK